MTDETRMHIDRDTESDDRPANKIKRELEEMFEVDGEEEMYEIDLSKDYHMSLNGEAVWYILKALELLSEKQLPRTRTALGMVKR